MCKFVKKIRLLTSTQMQSDKFSHKNRQQEDDSLRKFVKKKTSRDVELDVELDTKWLVVAQKSSTGGRLNAKLVLKKWSRGVEWDVRWRVIVQKCQQDDDLMCKFVKKKAFWSEKIQTTRHI